MDVCTLADVKKQLALGGDVSHDTLLADIIAAVGASIERHLDRGLARKERTEYFSITGTGCSVHVRAWPVSESPAPQAWSDYLRAFDTNTLVADDLYAFDPDQGLFVFDKTPIACGFRTLKITYTGGLAATPEELKAAYPDISLAARMQCVFEFRRRDTAGQSAISIGGGNVSFDGQVKLIDRVIELLAPHRTLLRIVS